MSEKEKKPEGVSRRTAVQTVGGAVLGLAIGAAAGWLGKPTLPAQVTTVTETATATMTATAGLPSTTAAATVAGGPGIDYYYDPTLKGTTINLLFADTPEVTQTLARVTEFEDETGIKVNAVVEPENSTEAKASLEFTGKSSQYDVIHASGFGSVAYSWLLSNFIESLEPYVAKTPAGWNKEDIFASVLGNCSMEGKLFTLPHVAVDYPYFYRTDVIDTPPKTLDEMMANAKKFHNPPSLYGFCAAGTPDIFSFFTWEVLLWAYGGRWFDENFHPELNSDAAYNATKYMLDIAKYAPAFTTTDADGAATFMAQGKIAQLTDFASDWTTSIIAKSSKVIGTAGYAPHPSAVCEPHMLAGISMAINSFSKQKDAAWSFISWATSPRAQQEMVNVGMGGTIRQSVATSPQTRNINPFVADTVGWLVGSKPTGSGAFKVACAIMPPMPRVGDFVACVVKNLAGAIGGTVGYKQAMDTAQEQATSLMKEIGLYK